jgi:hypothetical protein
MSPRLALLALVAFSLLAAGRAQASCGAEGCPLEIRGPESGGGRFGFELGYQFVDQNRLWDGNGVAGPPADDEHEVEVRTRTESWVATARGNFGRRLVVTSTLPYIDRTHLHLVQHHVGYYLPQEFRYRGFGDLLTVAQFAVLGAAAGDKTSLSLRGGIKLATGKKNVEEIDGEQPEPPARPSSGSTDVLAGFQVRRLVASKTLGGLAQEVPLTLSATWRWNGKGTEDYRMGNEAQATLAGGWAPTSPLRLLMQVTWRHHEGDEPGASGDEAHTTAGTSVYVTPGLRGQVTSQIAAFGYWQFRAYEHTDGPQLVAPHHLSFGLSYSL